MKNFGNRIISGTPTNVYNARLSYCMARNLQNQ